MDSEQEENMVEWLRDIGMPVEFVNKLARMFQDIKVSEDLNQRFKENLHDQEPTTAGNWAGSLELFAVHFLSRRFRQYKDTQRSCLVAGLRLRARGSPVRAGRVYSVCRGLLQEVSLGTEATVAPSPLQWNCSWLLCELCRVIYLCVCRLHSRTQLGRLSWR